MKCNSDLKAGLDRVKKGYLKQTNKKVPQNWTQSHCYHTLQLGLLQIHDLDTKSSASNSSRTFRNSFPHACILFTLGIHLGFFKQSFSLSKTN